MLRKLSISVVAIVLLMLPAQLLAGGAPRLFVPIDNVSAKNASECSKLITDYFGKRISGVKLEDHKGQWYATLYLREGVKLSEVQNSRSYLCLRF